MKHLIALFLMLAALFSFAASGNPTGGEEPPATVQPMGMYDDWIDWPD